MTTNTNKIGPIVYVFIGYTIERVKPGSIATMEKKNYSIYTTYGY